MCEEEFMTANSEKFSAPSISALPSVNSHIETKELAHVATRLPNFAVEANQ